MTDEVTPGGELWGRVLVAAMRAPGVRIRREEFLRRELSKHLGTAQVDRAIASGPGRAGVPAETVDAVAWSTIRWHKAGVSAAAATLALPPGWWNVATIPVDLAQFFAHVLTVAQKLAYLYGWPDLLPADDDGELDDETKLVLTLFVGAALGSSQAARGLALLGERVGAEVAKRLPRQALTKWALYRLAKEVAKWIGIRLTKQKFAEFLARGIPLVGAVVAGTIAWVSFSTMAGRLQAHLSGLPLAHR